MGYGEVLHRCSVEDNLVNLNVGGFKKKVDHNTLLRFPHTRLGRLLCCRSEKAILELCDDYSAADREYYFDRNPHVFRCVLNFYHTGRIHMMEDLCVFSFGQEIEYWGIGELCLGSCCIDWYQERKEYIEDTDWDLRSDEQQPSFDSSFDELSGLDKDLEKFEGTWCSKVRRYVWLQLEDPGHSFSAKVITVASLGVVLTSIAAMCVHSMPEFQKLDAYNRPIEDPTLAVLETACIICFSAEFAIRLAVAPCPRRFLGNPLNLIDFASILPFYATLAFETAGEGSDEENENLENVGKVVQVLRLMRIFRILKLARHSVGLRALGATMRHSYQEVGLLILFLSVGISIFSVLIYSVEKEEQASELANIPVAWWWATITMTTVGYGDTCPVTLGGKLVATLCIICGLLVVALPITIIFNKFSKYYQRSKVIETEPSNNDMEREDPNLPYFNVIDSYTQKMESFLDSLPSRASNCDGENNTDAASIPQTDMILASTGCYYTPPTKDDYIPFSFLTTLSLLHVNTVESKHFPGDRRGEINEKPFTNYHVWLT
ncbi:potassium voltage-gated channel subfamily S member 3-like [Scleropages formosus]|uniref:Potassium voltage-gated channel subfamily S member 3-like n=1 Tax=Scleropages formosus TaxID=113540 RepID=A0A0P7US33_SCLFO|nr:potassium voltage-gated channel subfamily S member 3-like [Scleropages formosus]